MVRQSVYAKLGKPLPRTASGQSPLVVNVSAESGYLAAELARRAEADGGAALMLLPPVFEVSGLEGLRAYLRDKRQGDFTDNLCKKLFAYALGRGLLVSDEQALRVAVRSAHDCRWRRNRDALGGLIGGFHPQLHFL